MNIIIRISSTKNDNQVIEDLIIRYSKVERELKKDHPDVVMNIEVAED